MNERMNIKITDFLRKEINHLIKEGCGVGEFTVVELKRKIKYRNLPDKEEITFIKKDYKIYERMIEDEDLILTYYIWLLAISVLLEAIEKSDLNCFKEASHLFAWCQVRSSDENTYKFDASAPFILCSYMSNGFKYLSRALFSLHLANQRETVNNFSNKRGFNYIVSLMDFIVADHILKNEKRQVNAPNDLLIPVHEQINILRFHCYTDMLIVQIAPTLYTISSKEDKSSFFNIFYYIRDCTVDVEMRKIYTELINIFDVNLAYSSSFYFGQTNILTKVFNYAQSEFSLSDIIDKYKPYERIPDNSKILNFYSPSIKNSPFPFIPNTVISFNQYKNV